MKTVIFSLICAGIFLFIQQMTKTPVNTEECPLYDSVQNGEVLPPCYVHEHFIVIENADSINKLVSKDSIGYPDYESIKPFVREVSR